MQGGHGTLLLASGLSVTNPNSFSRQLTLLRRFLIVCGFEVLLCGRLKSEGAPTGPAEWSIERPFDLPDFSKETVDDLLSRFGINQIILIGYPDHFPFLGDPLKIPVFFWYQSSKPRQVPELKSTTIVPLTAMTATHLERSGARRIAPVIPHGVDTEIFRPGATAGNPPAGSPLLLTVGANNRRKRFDRMIEAFGLVLNRLPEARLVIKTDAVEKPGGFDLAKLIEHHGVADSVSIITAELSDHHLARLYASSEIYIHTAEWEGFCIPVIEAMACGLPVVTHRVQGPGELVPYPHLLVPGSKIIEEDGVVLLEADPFSYAEAVVRLVKEPSLSRLASDAGRSAAVSNFDIRDVANRWTGLLLKS